MKKFKKFVSLLAAAAILAVAPGASAMEAEAAAPTTFYLRFDSEDDIWRMQVNEWKEDYEGRELYYLNEGDEKVKDGDIVVILDNEEGDTGSVTIDINARLSNLTVNRSTAIINAKGIDECYVLGGSYTAITGNITNAYVYDDAATTLHSNVTNLRLISSQSNEVEATVTVGGTVGYASIANPGGILKEYYNFKAGTFHYDFASGLMTDPANYSTSGGGPATPPAPNNSSSQGSTSSGAYDDVPKTGESNLVVWLFAISAACFAGSVMMRKSAKN